MYLLIPVIVSLITLIQLKRNWWSLCNLPYSVSAFHTPGHYTQKLGVYTHVFWRTCPSSWAWFLKKFAIFRLRPCGKIKAPDVDLISKKIWLCNFKQWFLYFIIGAKVFLLPPCAKSLFWNVVPKTVNFYGWLHRCHLYSLLT